MIRSLDGDDADPPAVGTVIFESNASRDLREERVVLPQSDVEAGAETAAALADLIWAITMKPEFQFVY